MFVMAQPPTKRVSAFQMSEFLSQGGRSPNSNKQYKFPSIHKDKIN